MNSMDWVQQLPDISNRVLADLYKPENADLMAAFRAIEKDLTEVGIPLYTRLTEIVWKHNTIDDQNIPAFFEIIWFTWRRLQSVKESNFIAEVKSALELYNQKTALPIRAYDFDQAVVFAEFLAQGMTRILPVVEEAIALVALRDDRKEQSTHTAALDNLRRAVNKMEVPDNK